MVSRLTSQKGIDLLLDVLPALLADNVQLALLGSGEPGIEGWMRQETALNPGRVGSLVGYDEGLARLIYGGADALLTETNQDTLFIKAAVNACKIAKAETKSDIPIFVQVTVETTGTLLVGPDIAAAATVIHALDVPLIGLNCATGPAEMSEHLRVLAKNSTVGISVMPNAGLPQLGPKGATYPLSPEELAEYLENFVDSYGLTLVGGCCGTTPDHIRAIANAVAKRKPRAFYKENAEVTA